MKIFDALKSRLHKGSESLVQREFNRLRRELEDGPRFCKRTVDFLDYRIDIVDNISFIWQFRDIFVDEVYLFNGPFEDPLIYDCGANVGLSCLYFKRIFPCARIKAFEADPAVADVLQKNLFMNGLDDIEVVKKAVWVFDGAVNFGCQGADSGSIYLETGKIKVDALRLRDWLLKEETVAFLKLDIEGAETDVLIDCADVLERINQVFFEYHSWSNLEQRLNILLNVLSVNGFRYHLSSIAPRKRPFVNHPVNGSMDLQLNVFAYRKP
jgi:FkbM family methyltransferase